MANPSGDSDINWSKVAMDLLLHDAVDKTFTVDSALAKELLNMCYGEAMDAIKGALAVARACNRKRIIKADWRMFKYICRSYNEYNHNNNNNGSDLKTNNNNNGSESKSSDLKPSDSSRGQ